MERRRFLDALVTAGSRIIGPDGLAVLSARYHLFVRATEGAYTCLSETGPHVSLGRRDRCPGARLPRSSSVHASAAVRSICLERSVPTRDAHPRTQARVSPARGCSSRPARRDRRGRRDARGAAGNLDAQDAMLCASCGSIYEGPRATCAAADCGDPRRCGSAAEHPEGHHQRMPGLWRMGPSMVRGFDSGGDAAASVLSTALYQALPPAPDPEQADQPGEGRKLLLFSDSRQAAAFFAPYLQTSYETIQHRRLIVQGLERLRPAGEVRVPDLAYHVAKAADEPMSSRGR